MTPKNPSNIQELEAWISSREDAGTINAEPVVLRGATEFRGGFVGGLYDLALLRGSAFGYDKSNIGIVAFNAFVTHSALEKLIEQGIPTGNTEFRAVIPTGLYNLVKERQQKLGLDNAHVMSLALSLFVHDPGVELVYSQFLTSLAQKHSVSVEEVEKEIFKFWRREARLKRYELSLREGAFVSDRKLS